MPDTRRKLPIGRYRAVGGLALTLYASYIAAQVTLDGTLGRAEPLAGPNYAITADRGQQVGGNLFHSFQTFSLQQGESATFSGPASVNNIIGRVTGGQVSHIDGVVRSTIPGANLYLLNPAGILFGENARLEVFGAFHASTAGYLRLGDNGRFDAVHPDHSVLTVAPVEAFGFLDPTPGPITVQGSRLQVPDGQTLSLLGGDLTVTNGTLYASAGRLNLATVGSAGEIVPTAQGLELRGFDQRGTFTLTHTATPRPTVDLGASFGLVELGDLDVSGAGGGAIFIRGGQWLNQNGWVFADTYGSQSGGGMDVALGGEMRLTGDARLTAATLHTGQAGDITLDVGTLRLDEGAFISTAAWFDNLQDGGGGDLTVNARDAVVISGANSRGEPSALSADALDHSKGDAGSIRVTTPVLVIQQGGAIQSTALGLGAGGDITLQAETVLVQSGGYVSTSTSGPQEAGAIVVETGTLALTSGGQIATTTQLSAGQGGDLRVNAREAVIITGVSAEGGFVSGIYASALSEATGNAGAIQVVAPQLTLDHFGQITGEAEQTSGGVITLQVDHIKLLNNSQITSSVQGNDRSDGGNVTLNSVNIVALNGSKITAQAKQGRGGNILVNANVFLHDAANTADILNASSKVAGNDGVVELNAPEIDVSGNLTALPIRYLDLASRLAEHCDLVEYDERSSLIVKRYQSLPRAPDQSLSATSVSRCIPEIHTAPTPAPRPEAATASNPIRGFNNR
ncbi:MAG: filamentous hemagglutinin N-terminal domain-containing protein [Gammaproteobacteria bacterium]|nr:filamentous hemagglutinin N-terminal domain-containing protein [Gammaproteobacteria bacterium]HRX71013.1 filamentous hemagglutinin N-terminal domain-containing protein [Candidatus Competibacteraceae bacterium]